MMQKNKPIVVLSAVYDICYLTGGSAVGLSFSVDGLTINAPDNVLPVTVL